MSDNEYAGFWLRVVAFIIDAIILSVVHLLLIIPFYNFFAPYPDYEFAGPGVVDEHPAMLPGLFMPDFSQAILAVVGIMYYAIMEASPHQASLGKIALELKVTSVNGGRLTFAKAVLRNTSKMLSSVLLMIGYVITAFTKRKQALHDLIAGALVVKQ